jgi:DNA-binding response OmpR family regulator
MKILLIDDSKVLQHIQQKVLVKAGYEVLSAKDGEEGLRIARESNPDLILLDIMLPKIAGQDVPRTFKRDSRMKHIPVGRAKWSFQPQRAESDRGWSGPIRREDRWLVR